MPDRDRLAMLDDAVPPIDEFLADNGRFDRDGFLAAILVALPPEFFALDEERLARALVIGLYHYSPPDPIPSGGWRRVMPPGQDECNRIASAIAEAYAALGEGAGR